MYQMWSPYTISNTLDLTNGHDAFSHLDATGDLISGSYIPWYPPADTPCRYKHQCINVYVRQKVPAMTCRNASTHTRTHAHTRTIMCTVM